MNTIQTAVDFIVNHWVAIAIYSVSLLGITITFIVQGIMGTPCPDPSDTILGNGPGRASAWYFAPVTNMMLGRVKGKTLEQLQRPLRMFPLRMFGMFIIHLVASPLIFSLLIIDWVPQLMPSKNKG